MSDATGVMSTTNPPHSPYDEESNCLRSKAGTRNKSNIRVATGYQTGRMAIAGTIKPGTGATTKEYWGNRENGGPWPCHGRGDRFDNFVPD